ncbi:hypothetical protein PLESTM_000238600 [Pleodorina starrii]|nr:hypothetical protein PLESTM_000238600 [Pleodorina starrii]
MRCSKALPQVRHHLRATAVAPAPAASCRPARSARRLCIQPTNVMAGLPQPPSPPPPSSPRTPKNAKPASSCSSPSLPVMLAGLSGGVLIGAAALHLGGDADHATTLIGAAASSVAPLKEFGPADVIAQGFGPARPLWSALLHSHQAVAASAAHQTAAGDSLMGGGDGAAASLISEARDAAEGAATAVRGAVGGLCDDYNRWLQESPLICKIVTGNFFTVAGDMLAQLGLGGAGGHGGDAPAAPTSAGGRRHVDWWRTGRLCLETSAFGTPLAHWWFNLLDGRIMPDNPHCPAAVMTKMLADQVLFAPLGLLMFFAVIKCLEGRPRDIPHTIRTSYVKSLLGGYLLWPAAGILNFALLPPEYRVFFNNCVNIIWTCFLSIMSSGGGIDKSAEAAPTAEPAASLGAAAASASASSHAALAAAVESAVLLAAISAATVASGRPSFGFVAGLATAAVESHLSACAAATAESTPPAPVAVPVVADHVPAPAMAFAAGGSVSLGGPCLEVCEQPVDALYETR